MNGMGDGICDGGRRTRRVRLLATTAAQQQEKHQHGKNCEDVCSLPASRSAGLHAIPLRRRKMSPQPCAIEWQDSIRSHHLRAAPFAFCCCACSAEVSATAEFKLNTCVLLKRLQFRFHTRNPKKIGCGHAIARQMGVKDSELKNFLLA
jgi:hypothetical protein